jgi:hypothetical protein
LSYILHLAHCAVTRHNSSIHNLLHFATQPPTPLTLSIPLARQY